MRSFFVLALLAANVSTHADEHPAGQAAPAGSRADPASSAGSALFLKNCAHCHAADGHGDEGPDLHNLDWTDEQVVSRIRKGKKGQMTAFEGKLSEQEIKSVLAYVRTLK